MKNNPKFSHVKPLCLLMTLALAIPASAITPAALEDLFAKMTLEEKIGQPVPLDHLSYWVKNRKVPATGKIRAWIAKDSVSGSGLELSLPDKDGDGVVRVLAIGNSFSICLHSHWPKVAASCGSKLDLCTLYIGGCSLETHAKNIAKGKVDPEFKPYVVKRNDCMKKHQKTKMNIPEALKMAKWDIVTIQQASHESWRAESYHPWADEVIACVKELAPQAEIRVQETWSYSNREHRIYNPATQGAGDWGIDQAEMYARLAANYTALAKENGFEIIPTGATIQKYRKTYPVAADKFEDDLVGSPNDSIHLNNWGEYLQALVWQKAVFGTEPSECAYAPEVFCQKDPARLQFIRECVQK